MKLSKLLKATISKIAHVPMLDQFMSQNASISSSTQKIDNLNLNGLKEANFPQYKYFLETYGCQMNVADSELVGEILRQNNFQISKDPLDSDVILLNTCAVRDNAEQKVFRRLAELKQIRKKQPKIQVVGVLGCMAERLKTQLIEQDKSVDIVVGPDAYRDLPRMIQLILSSDIDNAVNVQLSQDETYADIIPVRMNQDKLHAYLSIMRGCNNMCSFCIVPFTRGRERSRPLQSIIEEVKMLKNEGFKEILLLGQNVNSYHDQNQEVEYQHKNPPGFNELFKLRGGKGYRFAQLLEQVAINAPNTRIRFTSPHPKDFPEDVIKVIQKYPNICKNIHLPLQAGNSNVLNRMRRNYTQEAYLDLVKYIKQELPGVTLSTDLICGFPGETDTEFQDTIKVMNEVKYEQAFTFAYSMREKTHAHRNFKDDVTEDVKQQRLLQMIDTLQIHQTEEIKKELGRLHIILVEGTGRNENQLKGKTDTNRPAIIQNIEIPNFDDCKDIITNNWQQISINNTVNAKSIQLKDQKVDQLNKIEKGDFILGYVTNFTKKSIFVNALCKVTIDQFSKISNSHPFMIAK